MKCFKKCIPSYSVSPLSIIHSKEIRTHLWARWYKNSASCACQRYQDPQGCFQPLLGTWAAAVILHLLYVTWAWLLSEFTRNMNEHMKTVSQKPWKRGSCIAYLVFKKMRFLQYFVPASPSTTPSSLPYQSQAAFTQLLGAWWPKRWPQITTFLQRVWKPKIQKRLWHFLPQTMMWMVGQSFIKEQRSNTKMGVWQTCIQVPDKRDYRTTKE